MRYPPSLSEAEPPVFSYEVGKHRVSWITDPDFMLSCSCSAEIDCSHRRKVRRQVWDETVRAWRPLVETPDGLLGLVQVALSSGTFLGQRDGNIWSLQELASAFDMDLDTLRSVATSRARVVADMVFDPAPAYVV